jgi:uncharacterized protein with GYD domain
MRAEMGFYTSESWARMVENPGDRSAVARKACEDVGGNLDAFYWAFGPDDFVAIAAVPDNASAAAVSAGVSSSGASHDVHIAICAFWACWTSSASASPCAGAAGDVLQPPA